MIGGVVSKGRWEESGRLESCMGGIGYEWTGLLD